MGLEVGSIDKKEGMSWAIYQSLSSELESMIAELQGEPAEPSEIWSRMSLAIAEGVIAQIRDGMEVCAIRVNVDGQEDQKMSARVDVTVPGVIVFEVSDEDAGYVN